MRTDSSPRRAVRRAICRFATLTQAISSTDDTAPTRISSSGRTDSVPYSCKPTVRAIVRAFGCERAGWRECAGGGDRRIAHERRQFRFRACLRHA